MDIFEAFEELNKINETVETLSEDLIEDATSYTKEDIVKPLGNKLTEGDITSLIAIKRTFGKDVLYKALTSSFMRVCINLHHKDDILDNGWELFDLGIVWNFEYNNNQFAFVSTENTFDIYVSTDGKTYKRVLHSDHSHCSNTADVNEVLERDYNVGTVTEELTERLKIKDVALVAKDFDIQVTDSDRDDRNRTITYYVAVGPLNSEDYGLIECKDSFDPDNFLDDILDSGYTTEDFLGEGDVDFIKFYLKDDPTSNDVPNKEVTEDEFFAYFNITDPALKKEVIKKINLVCDLEYARCAGIEAEDEDVLAQREADAREDAYWQKADWDYDDYKAGL